MVLAHDANCFIDYFGADHDAARAAIMPNWHYTHISDDVLPALRGSGVTEAQIEQMLVGSPRRYYSRTPLDHVHQERILSVPVDRPGGSRPETNQEIRRAVGKPGCVIEPPPPRTPGQHRDPPGMTAVIGDLQRRLPAAFTAAADMTAKASAASRCAQNRTICAQPQVR